jgi:hypothetical protein
VEERPGAAEALVEGAAGAPLEPRGQGLGHLDGADVMAQVRSACDALELLVADVVWPLPKYREMLFPV